MITIQMWSSTIAGIIKCKSLWHYAHFQEWSLWIDLPKGLDMNLNKPPDPAASLQKTQRTEEQVEVYQE